MNNKFTNLRTCTCGWVYFGVSKKCASNSVQRFNRYFRKLSKKKQQEYYSGEKSSIKSYQYCYVCGQHYSQFKKFKINDCPSGVTLNPIIYEVLK